MVNGIEWICGLELRNRLVRFNIDEIIETIAIENGMKKNEFKNMIYNEYDSGFLEKLVIEKLIELGKLKTMMNGLVMYYRIEENVREN